ncbi:MAG TPA: isoprenylcysteine carboxylmethyltransferase family protein [Paenalcaligenes sp.]|nr:isoprenylcysteine carboxylmethyltransferase family protein [Paenalcaligenes sp.]
MQRLELMLPPPVVAIVVAGLMWLAQWLLPQLSFLLGTAVVFSIIVVLAIAAVVFGLGALQRFKRLGTTMDPRAPQATQHLVVEGVYRLSRNPMYLGVYFLLLCWAFYLTNWLALVLSLLFVAYITRFQIIPEERILQEKFGTQYLQYCEKVRRWI